MKTQKQAEVIWKHLMRGDVLMYRLGLEEALPVTQMVAVYILAHPGTIVERIVKHPYFLKYSRSTVKRAVSFLYSEGYIKYTQGRDKRANHLYFKKVD